MLYVDDVLRIDACFSALQRAENSSIFAVYSFFDTLQRVSVLFSEPKIPQFFRRETTTDLADVFQCSSASRKFLNEIERVKLDRSDRKFQCSSASRKFLNLNGLGREMHVQD
mgnify:CR=1 FL=1